MIPLPVVVLAVLGICALVAVWRRFWRDYQAGKAQDQEERERGLGELIEAAGGVRKAIDRSLAEGWEKLSPEDQAWLRGEAQSRDD